MLDNEDFYFNFIFGLYYTFSGMAPRIPFACALLSVPNLPPQAGLILGIQSLSLVPDPI
jgi:hypothetical protein